MLICYHFLFGACGCPYNDLVICKDSNDCLGRSKEFSACSDFDVQYLKRRVQCTFNFCSSANINKVIPLLSFGTGRKSANMKL